MEKWRQQSYCEAAAAWLHMLQQPHRDRHNCTPRPTPFCSFSLIVVLVNQFVIGYCNDYLQGRGVSVAPREDVGGVFSSC